MSAEREDKRKLKTVEIGCYECIRILTKFRKTGAMHLRWLGHPEEPDAG